MLKRISISITDTFEVYQYYRSLIHQYWYIYCRISSKTIFLQLRTAISSALCVFDFKISWSKHVNGAGAAYFSLRSPLKHLWLPLSAPFLLPLQCFKKQTRVCLKNETDIWPTVGKANAIFNPSMRVSVRLWFVAKRLNRSSWFLVY